MSDYSLGTIDPLRIITGYDGFDLPTHITPTPILRSTTSTHNNVLQSSGLPMPGARLRGVTKDDESTVDALKAYHASSAPITFVDCFGDTRTVVVYELTTQRLSVGRRTFQMTLLETEEPV